MCYLPYCLYFTIWQIKSECSQYLNRNETVLLMQICSNLTNLSLYHISAFPSVSASILFVPTVFSFRFQLTRKQLFCYKLFLCRTCSTLSYFSSTLVCFLLMSRLPFPYLEWRSDQPTLTVSCISAFLCTVQWEQEGIKSKQPTAWNKTLMYCIKLCRVFLFF